MVSFQGHMNVMIMHLVIACLMNNATRVAAVPKDRVATHALMVMKPTMMNVLGKGTVFASMTLDFLDARRLIQIIMEMILVPYQDYTQPIDAKKHVLNTPNAHGSHII